MASVSTGQLRPAGFAGQYPEPLGGHYENVYTCPDELLLFFHHVPYDHEPVANAVHFVGSIKWLESKPFGGREYKALARDMLLVPGAGPDTPLVAVSRCGVEEGLPLASHWGPEDLVRAWR